MPKNPDPAPVLVWFRTDLRLGDNPALAAAAASGAPVIPVYILDETLPHAPGAAWRWRLHHSLAALSAGLAARGAPLILRRAAAFSAIPALAAETGAKEVFWNRRYDDAGVAADKAIKSALAGAGIAAESFGGSLLREPWELKTSTGGPYRVFTPFWKALRAAGPMRAAAMAAPKKLSSPKTVPHSDTLADWRLPPTRPDWSGGFSAGLPAGEDGARARLDEFLSSDIHHYADGRDRPDRDCTSRLSPYLAHGEISPLQIWTATRARMEGGSVSAGAGEKFLSELAWRDFAWSLLYHYPHMTTAPLREAFTAFPWRDDEAGLTAWRKGLTGYPIVDAGMRQLWRTGWMHNRVRMIVASFLVKDLLIPWQQGEAWFRDTLTDYDAANNAASWQWVAGSGADAAPYFRIFNPVSQGEKFDPDGRYVRTHVPELANLPAKFIHTPWTAPEDELLRAGLTFEKTYPARIVDHAFARQRALEAYKRVKLA